MARLEAQLAERDKEVEHLKAAAAEEGQVLAAVKETMRIHVEGEERLQQQNSALQFQLADQQRLAADLGTSDFFPFNKVNVPGTFPAIGTKTPYVKYGVRS
jgi:hypothetical protein